MKPLSELTGSLLEIARNSEFTVFYGLKSIHESVSFIELPEDRGMWICQLHTLLNRNVEKLAPSVQEQVRKAWNEFFDIRGSSNEGQGLDGQAGSV